MARRRAAVDLGQLVDGLDQDPSRRSRLRNHRRRPASRARRARRDAGLGVGSERRARGTPASPRRQRSRITRSTWRQSQARSACFFSYWKSSQLSKTRIHASSTISSGSRTRGGRCRSGSGHGPGGGGRRASSGLVHRSWDRVERRVMDCWRPPIRAAESSGAAPLSGRRSRIPDLSDRAPKQA